MSTAFTVSTTIGLHSSSFISRQVSPIRPSPIRSGVSMTLTESPPKSETAKYSRLEANRAAKKAAEYRGPQGFTPYAELVNGRLAQMGFVIGLVTELVSGKPIGEQMAIMFDPLTHALQNLLTIAG